ncbi:MAG: radical SAM protein [Prevotella sp.]|nr:radical SAM protein [Prevotella sp.]
MNKPAPLIAIARHRLSVDGAGVTTLVAFHGCPLRCRYCLNSQCWGPDGIRQWTTPEALVDELMKDNLYFLATGGGVCFGGGEPLLRSDFIVSFCQLCPKEWRINLETSLQVETSVLEAVIPYVHYYYIDVKDLNPDIYLRYTGSDPKLLMANLQLLAHHHLQERVTIRLPLIANFNTDDDRQRSRRQIEAMGFSHLDLFEYKVPQAPA